MPGEVRQPLARRQTGGREVAIVTPWVLLTWTSGGVTRSRAKNGGGSYLSGAHDPRRSTGNRGGRAAIDSLEIYSAGRSPSGRIELTPPASRWTAMSRSWRAREYRSNRTLQWLREKTPPQAGLAGGKPPAPPSRPRQRPVRSVRRPQPPLCHTEGLSEFAVHTSPFSRAAGDSGGIHRAMGLLRRGSRRPRSLHLRRRPGGIPNHSSQSKDERPTIPPPPSHAGTIRASSPTTLRDLFVPSDRFQRPPPAVLLSLA